MALTLPTELVHYIIELALPPRTSATGTIRRQRLKVFSLVHRSWTPQAHQMLFEDLSLRLTQGEAECARVEALVALARRKSRPRRLDIREPGGIGLSLPMSSTETLVSLPLTEKLLKLCPDVTEIRFRTVGFSSKFGGVLPEWSWPRGLPTELRTVEVNIRRPFPVLPKELVASTLSDMVESTVKVRGPEETPIRLELWEPGQ
ncbi:hypothetical protein JCM6882_005203 [Rhodosporidiobolus microsporus]